MALENGKPINKIFAIVGATACGKTSVSVRVAERMGACIICCDSMQIYRGMPIGTAAPTADEIRSVPHLLFGFLDPVSSFSCSDYASLADREISRLLSSGGVPLLVGGTGLYLDSVLLGCGDASAAPNPAFRAEMQCILEEKGASELHKILSQIDPEAASAIHENNVKRVIRALEICRACGTKSDYDRAARTGMRYDARVVFLRSADRSELYRRIDRRVDLMLERGLLSEAERLLSEGVFDVNTTAAQAIGYKELLPHLRGEESLEASVEKLKSATRRYAKRQLTWFSSKPYVTPIDCDGIDDPAVFEKIIKNTLEVFEK